MEHKDDSSIDRVNNPSSTAVQSPIVISNSKLGSNSTPISLRPKQLFPSDLSGVSNQIGNNASINAYEYQSPMEKHLSKLLAEISDKEIEYQKTEI